jgi:hypothetical protein
MKKLFLLLVMLSSASIVFAQTESFCQSYVVYGADVNAIAVPQNKEFVLLKLYVDCIDGDWQININDKMWLVGVHIATKNYVSSSRDFPEGSAVVKSGKNIILKKSPQGQSLYYTLIGYFKNAAPKLPADLSGDGKVNFLDLAIFASQWLT